MSCLSAGMALASTPTLTRRRPGHEPPPPPEVLSAEGVPIEDHAAPQEVRDRWGLIEQVGVNERWWDPYHQSSVKGDRAIRVPFTPTRHDTFVDLSLVSRSRVDSLSGLDQRLMAGVGLRLDKDAFRPAGAGGRVALELDPLADRAAGEPILRPVAAYGEATFWDNSPRYDTNALRLGLQPVTSDPRGLLLRDERMGARVYGTLFGSRLQGNLAWLTDLDVDFWLQGNPGEAIAARRDFILANAYLLDAPIRGLTSEVLALLEQRPSTGERTLTLGLGAEGHIQRLNLSLLALHARGPGDGEPVRGWMLAFEPSIDQDWLRWRGNLLLASGDGDPNDGVAEGFDAPSERPLFAGAAHSGWGRGGLQSDGVALLRPGGLLPSLRSDSDDTDYSGPGLWLVGVGAGLALHPKVELSADLNALGFTAPEALVSAGLTQDAAGFAGLELSAGALVRPLFNEHILLRGSGSATLTGAGLQGLSLPQVADRPLLASAAAELILSY